MADKDLKLALKIEADLAEAKKELDDFNGALSDLGDTASNSGSGTDTLRDSARALISDLKAYEETLGRTSLGAEELYEQEQRLDRLMASGAINAKEYEEALTHLDKAEGSLTKEHDAQSKALQKLLRDTDGTGAALKKLDENAEKLKAEFDAGRISAEQYDRAISNIGDERSRLETLDSEMGQLGLTTQEAKGQMLTFLKQLATGEFDDAAMSLVRLSQRAQGGSLAFARFVVPILAATGALAAFAAISYAAWQDQEELEKALLLTGNAAGITQNNFNEMSRSIEESGTATIGSSREIALQLVSTGKFSREVMTSFGKSAALMQEMTGASAEEVVKHFTNMQGGVAKWAASTNESMNFLTVEQYNYIRSLEENGQEEAAMLAASEAYHDAYAKKVEENLNDIQRSWIAVKKEATSYWDFTKKIVSGDAGAKLAVDKFALENTEKLIIAGGRDPDSDPTVTQLRQRIQLAEQQLLDAEQAAIEAGNKAKAEAQAVAATARIADLSLRADRERQMKAELDKLESDFKEATAGGRNKGNADFSEANRKKLEDEIRKKYADKSSASKGVNDAKAAEDYVKKLEQEAAAIGKTTAEVRLLASEQHKLSDEQQMRVNGALIQINAEEEHKAVLKDNIQLEQIRAKVLRASGKESEAAAAEAAKQFAELRARLLERGNFEGVDLVDGLINIEKLKGRLDEAQTAIEKTLTDLQRAEQSIDVQREAGLISEYDARKQIVALHQATYAELDKQRPLLEELKAAGGTVGDAAAEALDKLNSQAEKLKATTDLLTSTLKQGLESGLEDAILGLADGTKSFGDAIRSVGDAVAQALAKMAAQALAEGIAGSIMGAAGGGGGIGGFLGGLFGFADGGYTGSGGKYQVAGVVHKGEGVLSQSDVAALGGPSGFYSLLDSLRNGYADGGLVGVPAPSLPSPSMPAALQDPTVDQGANGAGVTNRILNIVDPQLLEDYAHTPAFEKVFVNLIKRNTTLIQRLSGNR